MWLHLHDHLHAGLTAARWAVWENRAMARYFEIESVSESGFSSASVLRFHSTFGWLVHEIRKRSLSGQETRNMTRMTSDAVGISGSNRLVRRTVRCLGLVPLAALALTLPGCGGSDTTSTTSTASTSAGSPVDSTTMTTDPAMMGMQPPSGTDSTSPGPGMMPGTPGSGMHDAAGVGTGADAYVPPGSDSAASAAIDPATAYVPPGSDSGAAIDPATAAATTYVPPGSGTVPAGSPTTPGAVPPGYPGGATAQTPGAVPPGYPGATAQTPGTAPPGTTDPAAPGATVPGATTPGAYPDSATASAPGAGGGGAGAEPPADSPEFPAYKVVVGLKDGKYEGLNEFVSQRGRGILEKVRLGRLSDDEKKELKETFAEPQLAAPPRNASGGRQINLRSGSQLITILVKREGDDWKVSELSIRKERAR